MDLKERLRTLRQERGYSLRELSDRIEHETGERMSFSYLSSLERVGGTPSIDTVSNIAAGYGISVQALLGPVELAPTNPGDDLPPGLREFAEKEGIDLHSDWIDTLRSIQFRGERPQTAREWKAIYGVLDMVASQKEDDSM